MHPIAQELGLEEAWHTAFDRVEALTGGRVTAAQRQGRWRPAWFLAIDRDGEKAGVYFRGDRGLASNGIYTLEYEMAVLQFLEAHGIPVPRVYGFCDDPRGIVMEQVAGRHNLATAVDEDERRSVLDHYMEILAEIHRIDAGAVERDLGMELPRGAEALGLADLPRWEQSYRATKKRPEPGIEFMLAWLKRNVPERDVGPSLLCGDAGQFMFDRGRVTALVDLELAYAGDPLADLGGLRSRDLSEPLGDLNRGFARYAEFSGQALDARAIDFHTVRFLLVTPLATAAMIADPPPGLNLPQYLAWYLVYARTPLQVIADVEGIPLTPPRLPEPRTGRFTPAHRDLVATLHGDGDPDARGYEVDTAYRGAVYLERVDRYGAAVLAEDLDEVGALVERPLRDIAEADAALEAFVLEAGRDRDAEVVQLLYRRFARHELLLQPAMRELEGVEIQMLEKGA